MLLDDLLFAILWLCFGFLTCMNGGHMCKEREEGENESMSERTERGVKPRYILHIDSIIIRLLEMRDEDQRRKRTISPPCVNTGISYTFCSFLHSLLRRGATQIYTVAGREVNRLLPTSFYQTLPQHVHAQKIICPPIILCMDNR